MSHITVIRPFLDEEEPPQSDLATEQGERNSKSSATSSRKGSAVNDVAEVCAVKEEIEQIQIEECEVDLRQFSPLGPITLLEYIRLPPQPRVMGQWQMQELEPYVIKHNSYPILQAGQDITLIAPGIACYYPWYNFVIILDDAFCRIEVMAVRVCEYEHS